MAIKLIYRKDLVRTLVMVRDKPHFACMVCGILLGGWIWLGVVPVQAIESTTTIPNAPSLQQTNTSAISVKTVHPRNGNDLEMMVEQPADVAPYYRASLYSESSGIVTFLEKDIGHTVTENEKIVTIKPSSKGSPEILSAPFDGVISGRSVDPGTFVASAAIVPGASAIVTLERNDIVTVSSRMPDRVAPLISKATEAELFLSSLPGGGPLKAHITRLAPSLSAADRTIRVEIDLYNRNEAAFQEFMARSEARQHDNLKGREPPQFPTGLHNGQAANLIPGSYGRMRLLIKHSASNTLLPISAVVRHGGLAYVFKVDNGVAHRMRVDVDLEDHQFVHVLLHTHQADMEQRQEMLPTDEYVISNLGELGDNQLVSSVLTSW